MYQVASKKEGPPHCVGDQRARAGGVWARADHPAQPQDGRALGRLGAQGGRAVPGVVVCSECVQVDVQEVSGLHRDVNPEDVQALCHFWLHRVQGPHHVTQRCAHAANFMRMLQ